MANVIVFENGNGGVSVVHLIEASDVEAEASKVVPAGRAHRIIDSGALPAENREYWTADFTADDGSFAVTVEIPEPSIDPLSRGNLPLKLRSETP